MKKTLLFILILTGLRSIAQTKDKTSKIKTQLCQLWIASEKAIFPSHDVALEKFKDPIKESKLDYLFGYAFLSNGNIHAKEYIKGKEIINQYPPMISVWKLRNDTLNIHIKGSETESFFEYNIDYKIEKLDKDSLVLKLIHEYTNIWREGRK